MKKYINISILVAIIMTFVGIQEVFTYSSMPVISRVQTRNIIRRVPAIRIPAPTRTIRAVATLPNNRGQITPQSNPISRTYVPVKTEVVGNQTINNSPINLGNLSVTCKFSTNISYINGNGAVDTGYTPYGTWSATITGSGNQGPGFYDGVKWSIGESAIIKSPTFGPIYHPEDYLNRNNSNQNVLFAPSTPKTILSPGQSYNGSSLTVAYNTEGTKTALVTVTSHGQTVVANCTPVAVRDLSNNR